MGYTVNAAGHVVHEVVDRRLVMDTQATAAFAVRDASGGTVGHGLLWPEDRNIFEIVHESGAHTVGTLDAGADVFDDDVLRLVHLGIAETHIAGLFDEPVTIDWEFAAES
jgi:hypothetical protein